ncbi:hypothetical protein KL905_001154 [Ogataea polymorpha]|uniref:NADH-cytochrome b5 reductase n=1 Tax=Ogataea polymorpha TaxID=460523 RepID=A0A1B7SL13_9ASCO|nr:uncharacterized protein OGAPODRAFT_15555 [Ogataea polymorpha]KAG7877888.1 hypothetical protein KL937_004401 [Ogataea polymorpha]KAG7896747.1 hypothetical protein KL908_000149 [Ogataea polymorpha]KAG7903450.1 hypothetical protein KL935_000982 [Ogataea polymorpha]KAG7911945.1 hypothetical protein KL906_000149 [Ogataea polymorpha]KAG7913483.1 hypothetical protein KL907_000428 [Ogataea polymorpha]
MSFALSNLARLRTKHVLPIFAAAASSLYYYHSINSIASETPVALKGGDEWIDLKLKDVRQLSHDTKLLTFELPSPDAKSGLTTASCVMTKFVTEKGNNVIRPYTPISDNEQQGTLEMLVKHYDGGKMSSHIFDLKPQDTLSFKGPIQKWKWEPNSFKEIYLLGGGTGITPLYQLIHEILKNEKDQTKIKLLYGSKTVDDILLKPELDALANKHPDQFKVRYFVDKATKVADQKITEGFITKDVLSKELSGPSDDIHIFVCGPPPFYDAISGNKKSPSDQGELTGALAELGYNKSQVFKF